MTPEQILGTYEEELAKLKASGYRMDAWQRRAQKISWAVGNVLCMRSIVAPDEWMLRKAAAEALEAK